jgi:hypothetical protein
VLAGAAALGLAGCGGGPSTDVGTVAPDQQITVKSTRYQVDSTRTADSLENKYESRTAEGNFLVVTMKVMVTGEQGRPFRGDAVKAITSDGKTHEPDVPASELVDPRMQLLGHELLPERPTTGILVFDLPLGRAHGARLRVQDLLSNAYGFIPLAP